MDVGSVAAGQFRDLVEIGAKLLGRPLDPPIPIPLRAVLAFGPAFLERTAIDELPEELMLTLPVATNLEQRKLLVIE